MTLGGSFEIILSGVVGDAAKLGQNCSYCEESGAKVGDYLFFHGINFNFIILIIIGT